MFDRLKLEARILLALGVMSLLVIAVGLIVVGLCVEVFMSLGVVTGIADRACAFVLAGYCAVTALLWKQFWKTPDFRLRGASQGRELFWDFLKNLALGGGFLALAFGASADGFEQLVSHPLASSYPYSSSSAAGAR